MKRKFLLTLVILILILFNLLGAEEYISLAFLSGKLTLMKDYTESHFVFASIIATNVYTLICLFSLPGAAILTMLYGALFGLAYGVLLVSFASTLGATMAMILVRYLLRDFVMNKFKKSISKIDSEIEKQGKLYLFTLRLLPIFPFFIINIAMGVTKIPIRTFFWVSQIGMLPGTILYVNAGKQFSKLTSMKDIISPEFIFSVLLLALMPWFAKKFINTIKKNNVYRKYRHLKPHKFDYDVIVIGGGAAGLVTSYMCSSLKANVALVEKDKMGGDCLNTGCVPSKAFIRSSHLLHLANESKKLGIRKMNYEFSFKEVMQRVHQVINDIRPHDSTERYEELGVTCISGDAKILTPWSVEIDGKSIKSRNLVIACGAGPIVPTIEGLNEINYFTSETIWSLEICPKELLILGGGPIGIELAQSFNRLGSKVTIIEKSSRILAKEDVDVSKVIQECLVKEGILILLEHELTSFSKVSDQIFFTCESKGVRKDFNTDCVLLALGRAARTKGYGLEELGINLRQNGTIEVNEFMQTNYSNIFACGDITGPYQFTHVAAHQAKYCAINALFGKIKKIPIDYKAIPRCVFTDPEIATVGINETMAQELGISYELTKFNFDELDRAIADSQTIGFIKILTATGKDKILGATIIGAQASNIISEITLAINNNLGLSKILNTVHPYPTMSEGNRYVAGVWKKAHLSPFVFKLLSFYFSRRMS